MLDLDHARKVIEAEKCDTEDRYWCSVHEAWAQPAMDKCTDRPEVADVATELLAEVERLRAQVTILTQDHFWETGAVERVRALHKPIRWYTEPCDHPDDCDCIEIAGEYARLDVYQLRCEVCADRDEIGVEPLPWPCPTIRALEGDDNA